MTTAAAVSDDVLADWRSWTPTPLGGPDWYTAAGMLDEVTVLSAGPQAVVPVWVPGDDADYYHRPACLLAGERETGFLGDQTPVEAGRLSGSGVTVSPYAYLGGPALGPRADAGALVAELIGHGRRAGMPLLASHYLLEGRDDRWVRALTRAGGVPAVLGAHCHLEIEWPSLDDYHHHNQYLRRIGRQYRRWLEGDTHVEVYGPTEQVPRPDAVAALFADSARAHGQVRPPVPLYRRLVRGLVPGRTLITVSGGPGGAPRSAVAVLDDGVTLYPKFFGTRRPGADYFELAYGEVVALAIERGRRRIDYGGTTHAAKLRRGCRLQYALGVFLVLDEDLAAPVERALGTLSANKYAYFREVSASHHRDHVATPLPRILSAAGATGPMSSRGLS